MGDAKIFYRECKKICSEKLKILGFKSYKTHYYRVVDKSVQMFCFYAYGGRREVRFDIMPLGNEYMSRDWDGPLWLTSFIPWEDIEILIYDNNSSNDVETREKFFARKICDALNEVVLSGFEIANTTEDAYCLKRFWLEDCMKSPIQYIYEDYMWYFQLGQYEKAKKMLLGNLNNWKKENNIRLECDIKDEYDMTSYRNLMRPIQQWCKKSDEEIKNEIKRLEIQNLEILKWNRK